MPKRAKFATDSQLWVNYKPEDRKNHNINN